MIVRCLRTLEIITIGQAPRDDIADLFAQHAPAGTKIVLRGALDGLSDAEVEALGPRTAATRSIPGCAAGGT